jgi:hypothetical protein
VAQRGRQNRHEMLDVSGVGPPHVSALLASRRCGRITAVLALLRRPIASLGYGTSADQKTEYRGLSYSGADPFDDLNWLVAIRQYDTLRRFSFQDSWVPKAAVRS